MKSKEQEISDFWEVIVKVGTGFIIGGVVGFIAWITGIEASSIVGLFCLILIGIIIFCGIGEWVEGKLEKRREKKKYKKIKKNTELKKIKPVYKEKWQICPKCGYKNSKFVSKCSKCRTILEKKNLDYYCENCYTDIPNGDCCPRCGSTLIKAKSK